MNWRRRAVDLALAALSLLHVLRCRLGARRSGAPPGPAAAILVIRCEAKLGDNLLNIPFLRALRAMYPARPIHLLHHAATRAVYERCPYVDRRIEIDWPMSAPATVLRRLSLAAAALGPVDRREPYAIAVGPRWDEDLYAPFLAWFSGAARRVGFSSHVVPRKAWRCFGTDRLLTHAVLDRSVEHESRRPLRLLASLPGVPPAAVASDDLEFWVRPGARDEARQVAGFEPDPSLVWIAVAPGAAIGRRQWPLAHFADLLRRLGRERSVRILLVGSPAEAADCAALAEAVAPLRCNDVAGRLNLEQVAAALAACRLFIGNDSGLLHLAGAVGTPAVEISCHPAHGAALHANSPLRFGPTTPDSAVLRPPRPAAPGCARGCESARAHCIVGVEVEAVLRATEALLGLPAPDRHGAHDLVAPEAVLHGGERGQ